MSDYAYVADRAKKVFASVSRLENEFAKDPENWAISVNLKSMQKLAIQASNELERLAQANQIDVCQYRIVPMEQADYGLAYVSKSLLEYQNLFSQIYDSFKNGAKSKATIGREAGEESSLDFAYSYSGSLGVVLLAKSERDFFQGDLDDSIDALYQIMDIEDADTVREIANHRGRAVVKRIHDWSDANVKGGFSADVKWKRSDGRLLGQMIDRSKMERIVGLIDSAADKKIDTIQVRGILVAVSLPARSFHITVPDGESYSGHFDKEFDQPTQMTVGRMYDAKIELSDTYFYATDRHQKTNNLLSLVGPISAQDQV